MSGPLPPPELRRLPPDLAERARSVADGSHQPSAPRDAATVVLLRDARKHGIEAYVLERPSTMAFAPGMYVFPGGSVDPRDADEATRWFGPTAESWCGPLGADETLARALVCAAVRETFEESGVLLAGAHANDVTTLGDAAHWKAEQSALLDRTAALSEVLRRNGLGVRADLLHAWAHWVTPEIEPKRFDTRFFVAALPEGQSPEHAVGESEHGEWVRPADAVARHAAGEMLMLPPTVLTLAELAEYPSVADVMAAARGREVRRVLPRIVVTGEDVVLLLPGEPGYPDGHDA